MEFKIPAKLRRVGKNLEIRPFEPRDFKAWKSALDALGSRRNKWEFPPAPPEKRTRAEYLKFVRTKKERQKRDWMYSFAIFRRKDGAYVGHVSIMEVSRGVAQTAFLGYGILNTHWGKGYGKEAVRLCLDLGFKDLGLHRIEAGIEPGNTRSARLARSLGMRYEGRKKRALFLRGGWVDLRMYTLTTEDLGIKFRGPIPTLLGS